MVFPFAKEWIDTNKAIELAAQYGSPVTRQTVINWASDRKLGKKVGGRWLIDKNKLLKFLEGENV